MRPDIEAIRRRLEAIGSQDWPAGGAQAFRIAALQFFDYTTPLPTGTIVFGCTAGFSIFVFHAGADVKALLDYVTELEAERERRSSHGSGT